VQVTLRGSELVAVGPWPSPTLGLAVDLGTTKLAAYLLDYATGATLAARGAMNPQLRFGEDVVARLSHVLTTGNGAAELSAAAVGAINDLVIELCGDADVDPARVLEAVIVGNTAMHHLLLGLPVEQLSRAPYVPSVSDALDIKARELHIRIGPAAFIHFPPVIAGFVGSDHVAALLATNAHVTEEPLLVVDIGTNTEVCLAVSSRSASLRTSCSVGGEAVTRCSASGGSMPESGCSPSIWMRWAELSESSGTWMTQSESGTAWQASRRPRVSSSTEKSERSVSVGGVRLPLMRTTRQRPQVPRPPHMAESPTPSDCAQPSTLRPLRHGPRRPTGSKSTRMVSVDPDSGLRVASVDISIT
jgi:hypothetical protein